MGRVELFASKNPFARALGTATLSAAKILENMEIGHNVMHGQWDWMNDPYIHSRSWDWDSASTKEAWKHSHNYVHHTYTNIRGKDRDLGYEIMRIDPNQKWYPFYLAQPFYNLVLAAFFEWGVAAHDLNFDEIRKGEKDPKDLKRELKGMVRKGREQIVKDYIAWPALSGLVAAGVEHAIATRSAPKAQRRGSAARRGRGSPTPWRARDGRRSGRRSGRTSPRTSFATCGPTRSSSAATSPTRRTRSARRRPRTRRAAPSTCASCSGAANIEGSPFFHVASGNLGYQVEHHLYPDMPSTRYAEIAPKVKEICERYELPYNTGPFLQAARHGAAHDPAAGVPRRRGAAQAGALQALRRTAASLSRRLPAASASRSARAPRGRCPSGGRCGRAASTEKSSVPSTSSSLAATV